MHFDIVFISESFEEAKQKIITHNIFRSLPNHLLMFKHRNVHPISWINNFLWTITHNFGLSMPKSLLSFTYKKIFANYQIHNLSWTIILNVFDQITSCFLAWKYLCELWYLRFLVDHNPQFWKCSAKLLFALTNRNIYARFWIHNFTRIITRDFGCFKQVTCVLAQKYLSDIPN